MSIESCPECNKQFDVTCIGANMICGEEREPVVCPYCNNEVRSERTTGAFWIRKLEDLTKK